MSSLAGHRIVPVKCLADKWVIFHSGHASTMAAVALATPPSWRLLRVLTSVGGPAHAHWARGMRRVSAEGSSALLNSILCEERQSGNPAMGVVGDRPDVEIVEAGIRPSVGYSMA